MKVWFSGNRWSQSVTLVQAGLVLERVTSAGSIRFHTKMVELSVAIALWVCTITDDAPHCCLSISWYLAEGCTIGEQCCSIGPRPREGRTLLFINIKWKLKSYGHSQANVVRAMERS